MTTINIFNGVADSGLYGNGIFIGNPFLANDYRFLLFFLILFLVLNGIEWWCSQYLWRY